MKATARVELHLHTSYSIKDGISTPQTLIDKAAQDGQPAMAITDWNSTGGFREASEYAAKKDDFQLLCGLEFPLRRGSKTFHCTAIAINPAGADALEKIAAAKGVDHSELVRSRHNLVLGSACDEGELYRAILEGASEESVREIAVFYDYLEVQPAENFLFLRKLNKQITPSTLCDNIRTILRVGRALNLPVVAVGDVCFANAEQVADWASFLLRQGSPTAYGDLPLYFRTTGQMLSAFNFLGQETAKELVIENTNRIAQKCDYFSL